MPIYEYLCQACGHHKEVFQKISDVPLTDCPECGKNQMQKQISSTSFRLKGGGWYETDFKETKKQSEQSKPETKSKTESTTTSGDTKGDK